MTHDTWSDKVPASVAAARRRSQARMLALQLMCIFDNLGAEFEPRVDEFLRDTQIHLDLGFETPLSPDIPRFARQLAFGARRGQERYDALLARAAAGWSIARMTPVDRNILRLGVYELADDPTTPVKVVIDEAIELARAFGDTESPDFVNGILDAVRRELRSSGADSSTNGELTT